jgi:Fe-S cluster assembly protein SufD
MIATVQAEAPQTLYEQTFRNRLQALLTDSPEWTHDLRLKALSRFESLGFPTRRLEAWKYLNVRPLLNQAFPPYTDAVPIQPSDLEAHWLGENTQDVLKLVFVNGRFNETLSSPAYQQAGVEIASLNAFSRREALPISPQIQEEQDAFVALNTALFEDGALIRVADDTIVTPLIQILFLSTGNTEPRAAYPRNFIALGRQAKANLVIEYLSLGNKSYFNNSVNEFILAEGAQAEATILFSESREAWHLAATCSHLAESAKLNLTTVTLTGGTVRHTISSLLQGEKAEVCLNGLDVLRGKTEVYHHTVTEHWLPNCVSNQFYKGILDDAVKTEFNGMVFVAQGANGTDSQQLNKNLLLSEDARVWTRPQLQINADDVKCAHGATVGQLEKDQLFYLASRGLDRELAQSLLTYGFAEEIINRIENPLLRQYLNKRVLDNLRGSDNGLRHELGA